MTQARNIRVAIVELMQGQIGAVRSLTAGLFTADVYEGHPPQAQQALAIQVTTNHLHRFDVQLTAARPHKATPMSSKASYRIEARPITIRVVTHLSSSADTTTALAVRETIEENCSTAIGVLAYPGNLTTTLAGDPTGIASGMLCGSEDGSGMPRWEFVSENWKQQLHVSRILGVAIVSVAQAVNADGGDLLTHGGEFLTYG